MGVSWRALQLMRESVRLRVTDQREVAVRVRSSVRMVALAVALFAPTVSRAQVRSQSDTGSVVETTGYAQLTLQPTQAVILLAVDSRAATASQASALNAPRVRRLLAALLGTRPSPDSVLVIGLSVGPNENVGRGTLVDYGARALFRVVVRTLDSLGRYLDVALSNGATEVLAVTFKSDSSEAAQRDAMAQAYSHAHSNALALAAAAQCSLGRLLRVSTGPDYAGAFASSVDVALQASRSAVPVAAQGVTVTASVNAVWRLEQPR